MKSIRTAFEVIVIILSLALTVVPAIAENSQTAHQLEGIWLGAIDVGSNLRIAFEVSVDDNGAMVATVSSLDQNAFDIPVNSATFVEGVVTFDIKSFNAVVRGKLLDNETIDAGFITGNGNTLPLELKKVEKLPVEKPNRPQYPVKPYPYRVEYVTYENTQDWITISGTLTLPGEDGPYPTVLLIPGSGPNDRDETIFGHKTFLVLADYLTRKGIAVLRVDDRGAGQSTGDHSTATVVDFARDVVAGVEYLASRKEVDAGGIGLIGHSYGGDIAPVAATMSPKVSYIVLMAGSSMTLEETINHQTDTIYRSQGAGEEAIALNIEINKRVFDIVKKYEDEEKALTDINAVLKSYNAKTAALSEEDRKIVGLSSPLNVDGYKGMVTPVFRHSLTFSQTEILKKVTCPVLALNGDKDLQVSADINLKGIEAALQVGGNRQYTIKELPGLNHMFQKCETGTVEEYPTIEETIAPAALALMAGWILDQAE